MSIKQTAIAALALCATAASYAAPQRCQPGYQDASCGPVLMNSPQSAPVCDSGPGWQTKEPARWVGSRYTAPSCSYTPPPSCPNSGPGWQMTSPPVWNGSSYSAPGCSYTPEPTCPDGYETTQPASWNGSAWVGLACRKRAPLPTEGGCEAGSRIYFRLYFTPDGSTNPPTTVMSSGGVAVNSATVWGDGSLVAYWYPEGYYISDVYTLPQTLSEGQSVETAEGVTFRHEQTGYSSMPGNNSVQVDQYSCRGGKASARISTLCINCAGAG